jgi:hypothetical protein
MTAGAGAAMGCAHDRWAAYAYGERNDPGGGPGPTMTLCNRYRQTAVVSRGPDRGTESPVQAVQSGPSAARRRSIRAGRASGAPGRSSIIPRSWVRAPPAPLAHSHGYLGLAGAARLRGRYAPLQPGDADLRRGSSLGPSTARRSKFGLDLRWSRLSRSVRSGGAAVAGICSGASHLLSGE